MKICAHKHASCAHKSAQIFTKFCLVVYNHLTTSSFKFIKIRALLQRYLRNYVDFFLSLIFNVLSQPQLNHNSTQPNKTKIGFDMKMTLHHHQPPQTQHHQYLSCYWPNFNQTLNKGSWDHLQQIPTMTMTFVKATFVMATSVHIRNVSAVTAPILPKL